jgi:mono/diheme cytochrome c family protein
MKLFTTVLALGTASLLFSCSQNPNDPGMEFAAQMYHSIPFEPYSQVTDTSSEYFNTIAVNPSGQNQRIPAKGTIARRQYAGMVKGSLAQKLYLYDIPADSLDYAARTLSNPIPSSEKVVEEGKVLYGRYCQSCHGEGGLGDGKVADQYKGVANLVAKAKVVSDGHIFHVITHGKGRMWPHGSQVNPDERWKIVHFVKSLGNTPQ